MPSDSTHIIVNFLVLGLFMIPLAKYQWLTTAQLIIFVLSYFLGTVVLSPDLDCKSKASTRCGIACAPYRMMTKHRGLSHHLIWGVCLRVLYMFMIIGVVIIITATFFGVLDISIIRPVPKIALEYWREIASVIAGLFISNLLHIALDKIA